MRRIRVFYKVIIGYLLGSLIFTGLASCKNQVDTEYVDRVVEKEKIVEVEKPVTDKTPPSNVTGLSAVNRGGAIQLVWTDAADSDTYGYEVSYGEKAFAVILQGRGSCYVSDLVNGTEYTFTVKSVDKTGNKSEGVSVKATPTAGYLSISLSVPSDPAGGTPVLSNTSADVNVSFGTLSSITKAVWKAGQKGIGVKPNELLSDTTATALTVSSNSATFTVTDSGFYDVVARDSDGHTAWEQVEVKTIDKTAPGEIQLPLADFDESADSVSPIKITWIDPISKNKYDSRVDHYLVSYTINDGTDVTNVASVNAGVQTLNLAVPSGYESGACLYVTFKSVDTVGNVSGDRTVQAWTFSNTVNVTAENVVSTLENLTSSSKVVLTGGITSAVVENINSALRAVSTRNENIMISLDMSGTSGIEELALYAFKDCVNLVAINLPTCITRFAGGTFKNCSNLTSAIIPNSVVYCGSRIFDSCTRLSDIVIPTGLNTFHSSSFINCSNLKSVRILGQIDVLHQYMFYGCSCLSEVILPDSIIKIEGDNCFRGCSSLESITFNGTIEQWNAIEKVETWKNGSALKRIVCTDGTITL